MTHQTIFQTPQDVLGRKIAARLSLGTADLGHDISERLRVARQQAIARRKLPEMATARGIVASGGAAALQFGDEPGLGLWARIASTLPLLALVAGLLAIYVTQNDYRANEVAEIDAALLTDDLPTNAYTDPGFMQFLRADTEPSPR